MSKENYPELHCPYTLCGHINCHNSNPWRLKKFLQILTMNVEVLTPSKKCFRSDKNCNPHECITKQVLLLINFECNSKKEIIKLQTLELLIRLG